MIFISHLGTGDKGLRIKNCVCRLMAGGCKRLRDDFAYLWPFGLVDCIQGCKRILSNGSRSSGLVAVILHIRSRHSVDTLGIGSRLSKSSQPCARNTMSYKTTRYIFIVAFHNNHEIIIEILLLFVNLVRASRVFF
jgi:hypothetical protein